MRVVASALLALSVASPAGAADLIGFWDKPQHGGNSFNRLPPDQAYFDALHGCGAGWVRLSYDKWKPAKRERSVSAALQAYAAMTTSADTGAVRDVGQVQKK